MSDDDRSVSRSPSQEREKSEPPPAETTEEFKLFIGGISWHMDDRELKDSKQHLCRLTLLRFKFFFEPVKIATSFSKLNARSTLMRS